MQQFIDGGCRVPFYVSDCTYYPKHEIKEDYFEHDFKIYYKNCNRYFIGIHSNGFVRQISSQDYNFVLNDKKLADERANKFLKSVKEKEEFLQVTLF